MNQRVTKRNALQVVNRNCAGIDVHRDFVCATTLCGPDGAIESEYRTFKTTKKELVMLRDWLLEQKVRVAGVESTGKLWFPLLNVFSEHIQLLVYNARNIKNLPGRKTDKADSEWIAGITRHALITPSFIPDKQIRETRLISRTRKSLVQQRTSLRQQIHSILDSADIKISSVISDIFGYSGTNLLKLLCENQTITEAIVKKSIHSSMLKKLDRIMEGLDGYFVEVHRNQLKELLDLHNVYTTKIEILEIQLKKLLLDDEKKIAVKEKLMEIPGMAERSATLVLSEIGFDLSSFSNCRKFCNWVGVAPGKNESAGRNKSGRILMRQRYIRSLLTENVP
ncbi:MAG: IS110 family transposase [Candidatus Cloacimonetes bacterium]|nr:IS110 family transposase [Candidatus Cloacimonadota bacterium]